MTWPALKAQSVGSPPGRGLPFDGVPRYWALIGNSTDPPSSNIGNAVLEERTGGKKREGFISLLFIISGRSIYDRIGRDGTSSLANRNRDTGRRLAAQSSKPRFIFIVYISTLVESVVNFIAGSSPRPTFDKFSSPRREYEDRCSFPTDRYSPEQFRLLSPANYLSLWGTRVRESC